MYKTEKYKRIDAVLKDLEENPNNWYWSYSFVRNDKLGIEIWGHTIWGLSISKYPVNMGNVHMDFYSRKSLKEYEIGGVTMCSCFLSWLIPWRVKLWRRIHKIAIQNKPFELYITNITVTSKGA